jgi:hypothetical protein
MPDPFIWQQAIGPDEGRLRGRQLSESAMALCGLQAGVRMKPGLVGGNRPIPLIA